jgi:hypothetical protein
MNEQQASNKLMSIALNTDLGKDKDYVLAVKTLTDASKRSITLESLLRYIVEKEVYCNQRLISDELKEAVTHARNYLETGSV